jgi:LEA14-like dessication related protein
MLMPKRLLSRLLGLVVVLGLGACSVLAPKYQKPVVSVVGIQLVGGSFMKQNFLLKLNIQNPNDRILPVTSLHADLNVGGDKVATGLNTQPFVVPAQGNTQFDMTITANMALVLLKLASRSDKHADSIDYELTGGASIDLPFLRDLPFHQTGTFSPGALTGRP